MLASVLTNPGAFNVSADRLTGLQHALKRFFLELINDERARREHGAKQKGFSLAEQEATLARYEMASMCGKIFLNLIKLKFFTDLF
jgi:hypothetical protein